MSLASRVGLPGVPSRQAVTCPYCFEAVAPQRILFRCRGRAGRTRGCEPVLDEELAAYTGSTAGASLPPVFAAAGRGGGRPAPPAGSRPATGRAPSATTRSRRRTATPPGGSSRSSARRTPGRAPTSRCCCTS
ncbi:hypothetical protein ACFQHO_38665 [Actinomadura yumaensis]|uniref:hypothetical protein n=1 Tax=Actinomadura yumaensis TaxID=111807 RepID=UPI00360E16F6